MKQQERYEAMRRLMRAFADHEIDGEEMRRLWQDIPEKADEQEGRPE
jgi:hypothetical protein